MTYNPGPYEAADVAEIALALCMVPEGFKGRREVMHTRGRRVITTAERLRSHFQTGSSGFDLRGPLDQVEWKHIARACEEMNYEPSETVDLDMFEQFAIVARMVMYDRLDVKKRTDELGDKARHLGQEGDEFDSLRVEVGPISYFENSSGESHRATALAGDCPIVWFVKANRPMEQSGREYMLRAVRVVELVSHPQSGHAVTLISRGWFELVE